MSSTNNFDNKLALYRGDNFQLTDKISLRQPTLREICDFGESNYLRMVSTLLAHPFDMIGQLHMAGVDFTMISEFELFCMVTPSLTPRFTEIIFGDVDFSTLRTFKLKEGDELIAATADGAVINQYSYKLLCTFLRESHNFSEPKYNKVGSEYTKQEMIKEALQDLKHPPKKKARSLFLPLISSMVNCADFKYDLKTVWDLTPLQFFDAIKRIEAHEHANHLYGGLYSGCVELPKIRKELNWMREL